MLPQLLRFQSTLTKESITQQRFKDSMARIGSQAMILTSSMNNKTSHASFRGLTLSSVSSLSLKPKPLVQFNLQVPSFTSEALHKYKHFAIHLLKPNMVSTRLARTFSKGAMVHDSSGEIVPTRPFEDLVEEKHYRTYKLSSSDLVIPILKNAERVFVCEAMEVFKVGDHEIWVGEIQDILTNGGDQSVDGGVLYCNRKFHVLGDQIT
ncbi:LAMI_0H05600g1_1 [Lachancea mirantina]|uniref:LAMI_0H05600g1_1 n=1 Tax=Lachancea mirantina TaxID=1230905 RepID=A0A1G4KEY6_9SACH|nr:LAMI_0H05600g1_1 [Lachancea mirantina]